MIRGLFFISPFSTECRLVKRLQESFPFILLTASCLAAMVLPGCHRQPSGPPTVSVTGDVTLDQEPVKEGNIIFRQLDHDLKGFGGIIQNGKYQITVEPARMKVEIVASRPVPGKFTMENGIQEPVTESYIPAKYNTKSELEVDVAADQDQQIPFQLMTK